MEKSQVVSQTKKIQSQLKRDGIDLTLKNVREAIAEYFGEYDNEMELTDKMCEEFIEYTKKIQPAPLTIPSVDSSELSVNTSKVNLSVSEKNKIINSVAQEIDVSLPTEALKDIAHSVNWALTSRLELMQELRSQIKLWAKHQLQEVEKVSEEIRQETNQLFAEVSTTINDAIAKDNSTFTDEAQKIKAQVTESMETFRSSRDSILGIFAIPS